MEHLDIIDAHDNKIGIATREEIHKKELLHRGVCVLVFDSEGRIFVQKRALKKDLFAGLYEAAVCGHVFSGETYHQAATRELREELGIITTPAKIKEITRFGFNGKNERILVTLYAIKDFKGKITQDPQESVFGEFWTIAKLKAELSKNPDKFRPDMKKAIELFFELDGEPKAFLKLCVNKP